MTDISKIAKSTNGLKPADPKSTVDFQILCKDNIRPYLREGNLERASRDSGLLKGKSVVDLFNLDLLIKLKPNKMKADILQYLPPDVVETLVYERRRAQKLSERKQREATEKSLAQYLLDLRTTRRNLQSEKETLQHEINYYKLFTGEHIPNNPTDNHMQMIEYEFQFYKMN